VRARARACVCIANVPCFHSFAERSKELCRHGIKSLNNATMKEGSIGTRNCTVNTEKNVVARRTAADAREAKELRKKGGPGGIAKKKRGGTDRKKGSWKREEKSSGERDATERGEGGSALRLGRKKPGVAG